MIHHVDRNQNPLHDEGVVPAPTPAPTAFPVVVQQQPGALNDVAQAAIPPNSRDWSSSNTSCCRDEESCWWGTWCCWILQARTAESFGLSSSAESIAYFWLFIISLIVVFLLPNTRGYTPLFALVGGALLAWHRAKVRSGIRAKLGIIGSPSSDFWLHFCCSCLSVCQEAREAKAANVKVLDFCSGEELSYEAHNRAVNGDPAALAAIEGGSLLDHVAAVSKTSKIILTLCGVVALLCVFVLLISHNSQKIIILLLVFVQPFIVLYVVYWRSRRQYASLDYVIKIFAVGFWFTFLQSLVLEEILDFVFTFLLNQSMDTSALHDGKKPATDDYYLSNDQNPNPPPVPSNRLSASPAKVFLRRMLGCGRQALFQVIYAALSGVPAADEPYTTHGYYEYSSFSELNAYSLPTGTSIHPFGNNGNSTSSGNDHVSVGAVKAFVRANMALIVFGPLKDPHTALVYLMTAALGFATIENIEYVFGTSGSMIPGTSMLVGEILVLVMRVLLPIHLICATLQTVNLSKVILRVKSMNLFQILLPALLLHGAFDFMLFLFGVLSFVDEDNDGAYEIASTVLAFSMAIGGAIWAYCSYKKVQSVFDGGWVVAGDQDDEELTVL